MLLFKLFLHIVHNNKYLTNVFINQMFKIMITFYAKLFTHDYILIVQSSQIHTIFYNIIY